MEITIEEIADLPEGTYMMADVRSELSYTYGTIPKAVSMPDIVQTIGVLKEVQENGLKPRFLRQTQTML